MSENISHNLSIKLYDFVANDSIIDNNEDDANKFNNTYKCNKEFTVQMFGISSMGRTASIKVTNYTPFFYIKVDDNFNESIKNEFIAELKKIMGIYYEESIIKAVITEKQDLYGFDDNKEYKFLLIKFKNMGALNKAKKIFYKETIEDGVYDKKLLKEGYCFRNIHMFLYEAQIPPLLKLFHIKEIAPSGWIILPSTKTHKSTNRKTYAYYEMEINYKDIISKPEKEGIVKYNICSYDIEASSSHGDFPLAIKDYKKLAIDIIAYYNSLIVKEDFDDEVLKKCILTAFNFDDFDSINCVYPKNKNIEFTKINSIIDDLLKININKHKDDNDTDELDFSSSSDEELNVDDDNEDINTERVKIHPKNKIKKYTKSGTIIDVIKDLKCNYDVKLNELNKLLTSYLPKLEGDTITYIGLSFIYYGEKKPYNRILLVKGGCSPPSDYDLSGTQIISLNTEKEILLMFNKIFQTRNPHIVIGYNVNGFDFDFMHKRAKELDCEEEFLKLSFNKKEVCWTTDWKTGKKDIEKSKIFLASGEYNLKYIKMPGRVIIDLCNVFRRDHILSSYKLDYVSSYFISDDVKKYEYIDANKTKIYSKNLTGLTCGCYVKFDEVSYSVNSYKKGLKFNVIDIDITECSFIIEGRVEFDMKKYKIKWGLAKDDVSPQEIFKLANGSDEDRWIVGKYCLADCDNVIYLLLKNDIITEYVEMSNLCSVPLSFLFIRGQGIKLTSYLSKKCSEKNTLMKVLDKELDDSGYEGAHVFTPKTGLYLHDPVACVDYSSLYPSSIISENISHDSKVWTKEYDLSGELIESVGIVDKNGDFIYDNLPNYKYIDIKYDTYKYVRKTAKSAATKEIVGYKICRFAQFPNGERGLMPSVLVELLAARKSTRKQIPLQNDEFMKSVLEARQLSIKKTANSLYGQCGAKTSTFYDKDIAASTTAIGRGLLFYARAVIEGCYDNVKKTLKNGKQVITRAECVYGDTDSVFFKFNLRNLDGSKIIDREALIITIELAQQAGELATKFLKKPHDLEYEKTFWPFCLLSKKRYDGMLYETDPDKCKLKSMGNVLKRRDNAPIVKDIYGGVINILMMDKELEKSIKFVDNCLENMVNEIYPIEKLVVTKSLRGFYKNPNQIAHKVLANRMGHRDPGNKPGPGDRVNYAYIKNPDKKALQGEKIESPDYIKEANLKLDYGHYITNQIMKPLQQLFALELENISLFKEKWGPAKWQLEYLKLKEKWTDSEKLVKKYEEMRMKEIKALIFDKYLKNLK